MKFSISPFLPLSLTLGLVACDVPIDITPCGVTETFLRFSPVGLVVDEPIQVKLVGDGISQECTVSPGTEEGECRGSGPTPTPWISDSRLRHVEIPGEAYEELFVTVERGGVVLFEDSVIFEVTEETCNEETISGADASIVFDLEEGAGGAGGSR